MKHKAPSMFGFVSYNIEFELGKSKVMVIVKMLKGIEKNK